MAGRLSARYWLVIAALLTAFLVVGGAVEMFAAFRENESRLAAVQRAQAQLVAGRVDQFLETIERSLSDTAALPWRDGLLGLEDARQEFHRLLKINRSVLEVRGFDGGGQLVLRVSRKDPDEVRPSISTPAIPRQRGFGDITYRNDSEPITTLSIPSQLGDALFSRLEADLTLKFAGDEIKRVPTDAARRAYLVDRKGNLIAHPDQVSALRRLNVGNLEHISRLRASGESEALIRSRDAAGAEIFATGARLAQAPWLVVIEEPLGHARQDAYATAWRTALLVMAGLLAAVAVSFLLARRLSRPIVEVRRGASRIADGDLAARIDVKTGDEIEALANEFNRMAGQLQEYTSGLERKVEEKTSELQGALQVAQEAMRARAIFLAAASHDLRQPLHAISLYAGALNTETLPTHTADIVKEMRRAIDSLRLLFDNLLDLSRFDARDIKPVFRDLPLRDVLAPVAAAFEMECQAKGLGWKYQVPNAWVRTDPELMRRMVRNLLSNAVRYTQKGEVHLVAIADGARALVQVVDTGIGIAPEDQARVFEEFVQLDNEARDRDRGVGLGLSIVKRIADLIHAPVRIDSRIGGGTTVSFECPTVAAGAVCAADDEADHGDTADFTGLLVWAVDDDREVRAALRSLFGRWGARLSVVSSRKELIALREATNQVPDAVILDDMIGGGDTGLGIAQWLRSFVPAERIVLVTGNVDEERTRLLERSGHVVLRKPLAAADLAQWLQDATATARTG